MNHPQPPHLLLISQTAHGHLNPTIHLANNLVLAGARVTIATTVSGFHHLKSLHPTHNLSIASFSDGHDDDINAAKLPGYVHDLERVGSETLTNLIRSLPKKVNFIVYTLFLPWVAAVACKLNTPSAVLLIQSATSFSIYERFCNGREGIFVKNNKDTEILFPVKLPGLPLLKRSDLPTFLLPTNQYFSDLVSVIQQHLRVLENDPNPCVLVNTLDGLEPDSLQYLANAVIVGPLVPYSFSGESVRVRGSYFQWLDSKQENSVVYVSFGSMVVLNQTQKLEILDGLIEFRKPFLFVLREDEEEINELNKRIGENGLIVDWCSQSEVLRHRAIGCFVTHCGWNSTLESMTAGVPIVGCPQFADQTTNAKMVEEVWRNGVRAVVDETMVVRREEIKRCLEVVMGGGETAEEIKKMVVKWKNVAEESVKDGGSLHVNLKLFLERIQ